MKKLVFASATYARDGKFMLPVLPCATGPFQNMHDEEGDQRTACGSIAVLAFPFPPAPDLPSAMRSTLGPLDVAQLSDGSYAKAIVIPARGDERGEVLEFQYDQPVQLSSVTFGMQAATGFGAPLVPDAIVELSDDGMNFRPVAVMPFNETQARTAVFRP